MVEYATGGFTSQRLCNVKNWRFFVVSLGRLFIKQKAIFAVNSDAMTSCGVIVMGKRTCYMPSWHLPSRHRPFWMCGPAWNWIKHNGCDDSYPTLRRKWQLPVSVTKVSSKWYFRCRYWHQVPVICCTLRGSNWPTAHRIWFTIRNMMNIYLKRINHHPPLLIMSW